MKDDFNFLYDKRKDDQEAGGEGQNKITSHELANSARTINFVLQNGEEEFFYYMYFAGAKISAEKDKITLKFSDQKVVLKGIMLDEIYKNLQEQLLKEIRCVDERYLPTIEEKKSIVTDIILNAQDG